ncbi:MAG: Cache 3/Cache 2 fusion domain-containing protein [Phycisphaerae bacterium]|nr:Cache 3/Cache 2 fusion domain-containing protein [Phycisphaerae bacterium]
MRRTLSLGKKLIVTSLLLVLLPMLVVGLIAFGSLKAFGSSAASQTAEALEENARQMLAVGAKNDRSLVTEFVTRVEVDAHKLAQSSALADYLAAQTGESAMWRDVVCQQIQAIIEGIDRMCQTQQAFLDKVLSHNLKVAGHVLSAAGAVATSAEEHCWHAVNQFSHEVQETRLPILKVGDTLLTPNGAFDVPTPIVDDVAGLVGGVCTIFQRMNEQGDMLRVATNVRTADGIRAVGTFIPAVGPDGKANPVVSPVLKGESFVGRAFVVDSWCVTAYQPLRDAAGQVAGMLFVGIKERENDDLARSITSIKIGEQGYPFVMDSQGVLIVHPRADLVGKNVMGDLKLNEFKEILANREAGKVQNLQYVFEGRQKLVSYVHFAKWDWIICCSAYVDDLSRMALEHARRYVVQEMAALHQLGRVATAQGDKPLYPQIRFLDAEGNEVFVLKDGQLQDQVGSRADAAWFQKAAALKAGSSHVTRVEIAQSTGQPEIRVATPVYCGDTLRGVVVINADWNLTKDLYAGHVYGQTGYPYIIDDKGVMITHPQYSLKDHVSLADAQYGVLAQIVKDKMIAGEEGTSRYTFEGVDKFVSYTPLALGDYHYTVATACPVAEVMVTAQTITAQTRTQLGRTLTLLGLGVTVMALIGVAIGVWTSRRITKPIGRIITGLTEGASHVSGASGQVSAASQSLAEGATEQAAGLQETSSSLEEMSSMTKQNADNAQQANTLASQAKLAAGTGAEAMTRMSQAIQEIQKSSDETSKIIKVIDEIAFQTNLLALNAAVEAARAGEAGKGFAVVAEEVRNLAMRSAEAAKNTASMIEESVKNAKNGVDIAGEVGKVLDEIVQSVGKTTDLVSEIAAASQEQAQGIDQVNTAIAQMDKVTQQNAANAEESASASGELSTQAESMQEIVGQLVAIVGGAAGRKTGPEAARTESRPVAPHVEERLRPVDKPSSKRRGFAKSDEVLHKIAGHSDKKQRATGAAKPLAKAIPLNDQEDDGLGSFNA